MFISILKFLGLSNKHEKVLSENFEENKGQNHLTEQVIDSTSDDDLLFTIFENLNSKLPKDYKREYAFIMQWTKPKQSIYLIWLLEAEVNNGGYNQFYSNSSGQFYKILPEALNFIGAIKFAELMEKANKIYEQEHAKIIQHQDGTVEGFSKSYDNNPLNKFDDEFYELYKSEDLEKLQVEYVRKHKHEFIN
jgi:hypothetical protein